MKNILRNNLRYIVIFFSLFVITICLILYMHFFYNKYNIANKNKEVDKNKNNVVSIVESKKIYEYAKRYIEENKDVIYKNFKDRKCINQKDGILIGTNEKELENGYYDICIVFTEKKLEIHILKLWKNINCKGIYEDEYIKELTIFLLNICNKETNETNIIKMNNYIINCYLDSKKQIDSSKQFVLEDSKIVSNIKEGELVMSIF